MVRRIAPAVLVAIALAVTACSGSNEGTTPLPEAEPSARPASVPRGPTAAVEPRSGPPGSEITITGAGWPGGVSIDVTGILPAGVSADPYATTTTDDAGGFTVRFRLERTPDGDDLAVGRFDLIVQSAATEVDVPFLVETRRPIRNSGPGG